MRSSCPTSVVPAAGQLVRAGPAGVLQGLIRVVSIDGTRAPAAILDDAVIPRQHVSSVRVDRTEFGNLCVLDEWRTVRIDTIEVTADHRLVVGGSRRRAGGVRRSTLVLESPRARASAPAREQVPGGSKRPSRSSTTPGTPAPTRFPAVGTSSRVEPQRRTGAPSPIAVVIEHAVTDTAAGHHGHRRRPGPAAAYRRSPAAGGSRPAAHRRRTRAASAADAPERAPTTTLDDPGESPARCCSAPTTARSPAATSWRSTGSSDDAAPATPSTGRSRTAPCRCPTVVIPVIYESAEWYRLLHEAEFYLDNMHQPIYHRKPPHQVQVQTFHGYPFKQMGQPELDAGASRDRPRRVLPRPRRRLGLHGLARQLRHAIRCGEAFGFPHEVLEIGYPRNDVLLGPRRRRRSGAATRARLGIREDQCVVLYAPTFRDELAKNDFTAAMVDFLDVDALTSALGPSARRPRPRARVQRPRARADRLRPGGSST